MKIAAVLHDILEDTGIPREYLLEHGYSEKIVSGIEGVTKMPEEEGNDQGYMRFVQRAASSSLSKQVKIADRTDNLDLSRIPQPTEKDHQRIAKYQQAMTLLKSTS